jgi:catechol 2,3-dioxygenase-like lactoylglutathione lyase family enzyme
MTPPFPARSVMDVASSVAFYRDTLGMTIVHQEDGFAILRQNNVELHLWAASDEGWRSCQGGHPNRVGGGVVHRRHGQLPRSGDRGRRALRINAQRWHPAPQRAAPAAAVGRP